MDKTPTKEQVEYHDAPMKTTDAASMLRQRVRKNDRPYTTECVKLNNRLVDEWKKNVLDRLANSDRIVRSVIVWPSWNIFCEGKQIAKVMELQKEGLLPRTDPKVVEYWVNFFESATIEQMHQLGHGTISFAWVNVQNDIRLWCAQEKWERIYSLSDDPVDWYNEAFKHQELMDGKVLPYWNSEKFSEIQSKIATILHVQVEPKTS